MRGIGNTPLVKLERLVDKDSAEVFVKLESANPTGSMKDRMALSMIEGAEKNGNLKKGYRVIDYTGGSTGSSLALICAYKGFNTLFVTSNAFAEEKLKTMKAFGAELEFVPSENGKISKAVIANAMLRVKQLKDEPDTFWTDQFNNVDNKRGYHSMAKEILIQMHGNIDEFIAGVGTGGCFSGNAEILKAEIPNIRCIAIEPDEVRALSGGNTSGVHRLEGMGAGFIPSIFRIDLVDEIIAVKDTDAFDTARELATKEGIFGGISSGANVWVALHRAKILGKGKRIITVICDSGLKYLSGNLFA
ncbi:MAG: PLP-dependent cysteine synthase family protein [Chitinophagales bacterium]